ncbi:hypothetical protein [Streptomyces sp. NPDC006274]|uniref:hypothetical protein n=1 Tax=unclassified Streptomyces TaxID=2593676 RepID=UPI0033A3F389
MTIQLDGLGRQLRDLPVEPIAVQESDEGPVFVDESGRRSKKLRRIGWVLAAACACYAITLAAALIGGDSSAPWMPGLGQAGDQKPEHVEIQPAPTDRESAVATPGAPSGKPAPEDSVGTVPRPSDSSAGSSSPATAPPGSAPPPAATPAPRPASSGTGADPGGGPAAPASSAPTPDTTPSGGSEPSEPAAPTSDAPVQPVDAPVQPVQEGAP